MIVSNIALLLKDSTIGSLEHDLFAGGSFVRIKDLFTKVTYDLVLSSCSVVLRPVGLAACHENRFEMAYDYSSSSGSLCTCWARLVEPSGREASNQAYTQEVLKTLKFKSMFYYFAHLKENLYK